MLILQGFGVLQAKSRHMLYVQKLKSHHDLCEKRYEAAQAERQKKGMKRAVVLRHQQDTAVSPATPFKQGCVGLILRSDIG